MSNGSQGFPHLIVKTDRFAVYVGTPAVTGSLLWVDFYAEYIGAASDPAWLDGVRPRPELTLGAGERVQPQSGSEGGSADRGSWTFSFDLDDDRVEGMLLHADVATAGGRRDGLVLRAEGRGWAVRDAEQEG